MSPVLVTGGSGYVGTQLVAASLRDGRPVRATVRSPAARGELRAACAAAAPRRRPGGGRRRADLRRRLGGGGGGLRGGPSRRFADRSAGGPRRLIVPAREGTLRVLRAARDAGARRVVLTSSFVAIGYTPKPAPSTPRPTGPIPTRRACALSAFQGDRRARRLGLHGARRRRHRTGRGQPDVHPRPDPDDHAGFLVAADQGDAGRDDARRAASALRRRRRA